ncbi:hypothetical protein MycrhDRAFT_6247 [Mycolicibacterium rhodesiae JS60]|nr:hypothetical protein MycrhDRAFT_6247 [Mycolicibacterium rhodesiae JS60]
MAAHATHRPARGLRAYCGSWSPESSDPGTTRRSTPRRPRTSDQTVIHHMDARSSRNAAHSGGPHSAIHNERHGCLRGGCDRHPSTANCTCSAPMPHAISPAVTHSEPPSTRDVWRALEVTVACNMVQDLHDHCCSGVINNPLSRTAERQSHCLTCRPIQYPPRAHTYRHAYSQIRSLRTRHVSHLSVGPTRCIAYRQVARVIPAAVHSGRSDGDSHCDTGSNHYRACRVCHGVSVRGSQCTILR